MTPSHRWATRRVGDSVRGDITGGYWTVASPPPIYRPTRGPRRGFHVLHICRWGPIAGRGYVPRHAWT
eukprot:scaffold35525_cov118-Isochrysis_galbana.AAC.3